MLLLVSVSVWKKDKDQVCDEKNGCKKVNFKKSPLKSAEISLKIKGVDLKKKGCAYLHENKDNRQEILDQQERYDIAAWKLHDRFS